MYHSVSFISDIATKNTYSNWHLVPSSRPTITMPYTKTTYVDIPGASGKLDLSETLTKYPIYDNRTGSIDFYVLNDWQTNEKSWVGLYEEIARFVHGKKLKMVLEDDPDHYYEGRFDVTWESDNSGKWSSVSFDYDLDPYKYRHELVEKIKRADSASIHLATNDSSLVIESMPVVPIFEISNVGSSGINIDISNEELEIDNLTKRVTTGGTFTFYDLILSNVSGNNNVVVDIVGSGRVRMYYRNGDL